MLGVTYAHLDRRVDEAIGIVHRVAWACSLSDPQFGELATALDLTHCRNDVESGCDALIGQLTQIACDDSIAAIDMLDRWVEQGTVAKTGIRVSGILMLERAQCYWFGGVGCHGTAAVCARARWRVLLQMGWD